MNIVLGLYCEARMKAVGSSLTATAYFFPADEFHPVHPGSGVSDDDQTVLQHLSQRRGGRVAHLSFSGDMPEWRRHHLL